MFEAWQIVKQMLAITGGLVLWMVLLCIVIGLALLMIITVRETVKVIRDSKNKGGKE